MIRYKLKNILAAVIVLILAATTLWAAGGTEPTAAADKKYVTDPSTGKVVVAPQYGGTITFAAKEEAGSADVVISGGWASGLVGGVVEKLAIADWATPRDEYDFQFLSPPTNTRGELAESWSLPDPLTYIVKVRQGVRWHDKAPMNGRELVAEDIVFNFHRITGTGSGFTELSEQDASWASVQLESITATDDSTVVFRLKELNLGALTAILDGTIGYIYPPEVVKGHGDVTDWRNLVGTGPLTLTDWTEGSSITWDKNPDYWGYDEKYPENRLPYIDQLRALVMPEVATQLAALRTGQIDYLGHIGAAQLRTLDQVESLQRTNPEIVIWPLFGRSNQLFGMNSQLPPFDDIRVRKAMQMAIDLETINNAYYGGNADITPQGELSWTVSDAVIQFEDWPEDVKKVFDYDPEGAEALLDEAGYPRGANGTRFETVVLHLERYDLNYLQLVASYWADIGIDVEIDVQPLASFVARRSNFDFEMISAEGGMKASPFSWPGGLRYTAGFAGPSNTNDPQYDALYNEKQAATTIEESNRRSKTVNQYVVEKFWRVWGPMAPTYSATQPWIIGYNGELQLGVGYSNPIFIRLWIDQDLKRAMGR